MHHPQFEDYSHYYNKIIECKQLSVGYLFCIILTEEFHVFTERRHVEKDTTWKDFFDDNARYADIINGLGCDGAQYVKPSDLQEADTGAKKKNRDLLRKTAFGTNFALIGIENQEEMDYEIPLRVMYYNATRYQKQANQIAKVVRANNKGLSPGEYLYGFTKNSKLYPIITFVLYYGKESWNGPVNLSEILDFSNIPEQLKTKVSDYKVNIVDIRNIKDTSVFKTDVKQVFDFIRNSENGDALLQLVKGDPYYKSMELDAFEVVTKYANSENLIEAENYVGKDGKGDVCKAITELMESSREQGEHCISVQTAQNFFKNGADFEMVQKSITALTKEELQEIYDEVMSVSSF